MLGRRTLVLGLRDASPAATIQTLLSTLGPGGPCVARDGYECGSTPICNYAGPFLSSSAAQCECMWCAAQGLLPVWPREATGWTPPNRLWKEGRCACSPALEDGGSFICAGARRVFYFEHDLNLCFCTALTAGTHSTGRPLGDARAEILHVAGADAQSEPLARHMPLLQGGSGAPVLE